MAVRPTTSEPLGFLSMTGALLAALLLLGIVAWTMMLGPNLFSPGPLSAHATGKSMGGAATHAQLAADCGACHTAPWSGQTMADRCLACHENVARQIESRSGLHGRLAGGAADPTCRGCHTEHHGVNAPLTVVDARTFPHGLTGYSLIGHEASTAGAKLTCKDCHPKGLAVFDQAICHGCHVGIDAKFMAGHDATFGRDCLSCHDGIDRFGPDFDHNRLAFQLAGKHATTPCVGCHANAGSLAALQKTPHDCYSCHAKDDRHKGAFGQDCGSCHSPVTWKDATFDHSVFPVDHGSEERKPTCKTCHPKDPSSYTCYGCHEHTPASVLNDHEGKTLAEVADCIRCHRGGQKGGD